MGFYSKWELRGPGRFESEIAEGRPLNVELEMVKMGKFRELFGPVAEFDLEIRFRCRLSNEEFSCCYSSYSARNSFRMRTHTTHVPNKLTVTSGNEEDEKNKNNTRTKWSN